MEPAWWLPVPRSWLGERVRPRLSGAVACAGWAGEVLLRHLAWRRLAGSPVVVFVLAGVVCWLIGVGRDHGPGISG